MDDNFNNDNMTLNPSERSNNPCESADLLQTEADEMPLLQSDVSDLPPMESSPLPLDTDVNEDKHDALSNDESILDSDELANLNSMTPVSSTAAFEEIKPVAATEAPAFEEIKPVAATEAPAFEEIKPVAATEAPAFEEIKPIAATEAPAFEEIKPVATPEVNRWSNLIKDAPQPVMTDQHLPIRERILNRLRTRRFEPTILLNPVRKAHTVLDTKFGGSYYIPEGKKVPRNLNTGAELFLLAQINFDTMPKQPDFPQKGLLQFFIDPDPHAFSAHVHPTQQIAWRVRYIPQTPSYIGLESATHTPDMSAFEGKLTTLPFDHRRFLMLEPSDAQQFVSWEDFPFQAMLDRYCSDMLPTDPTPQQMAELCEARMEAMNQLRREFKPGKAQDFVIQLGGYPTFHGKPDIRVEDPRFPGIRTPNVLLLQLPSFDGFNWGGNRVVHFFISRKDLRECNFNNVMMDI